MRWNALKEHARKHACVSSWCIGIYKTGLLTLAAITLALVDAARARLTWCIGKYTPWSDTQCKSLVLCMAREQPAPYLEELCATFAHNGHAYLCLFETLLIDEARKSLFTMALRTD